MAENNHSFLERTLLRLADSLLNLSEQQLEDQARLARFLAPCQPLISALHNSGDDVEGEDAHTQCENIVLAIEDMVSVVAAKGESACQPQGGTAQHTLMDDRVQDGLIACAYLLQRSIELKKHEELLHDTLLPIHLHAIRLLSSPFTACVPPRLAQLSRALFTALLRSTHQDAKEWGKRVFSASFQHLYSHVSALQVREVEGSAPGDHVAQLEMVRVAAVRVLGGMLLATTTSPVQLDAKHVDKAVPVFKGLLSIPPAITSKELFRCGGTDASLKVVVVRSLTHMCASGESALRAQDWEEMCSECIRLVDSPPIGSSAVEFACYVKEATQCLTFVVECVLCQGIKGRSLYQMLRKLIEPVGMAFEDTTLHTHAITCLVRLAELRIEIAQDAADLLVHCLNDANSQLNTLEAGLPAHGALQTHIIAKLCTLLKHHVQKDDNNLNFVSDTVISVASPLSLVRLQDVNPENVGKLSLLVETIGSIASTLRHPRIIDQVRRLLIDQYSRILGSLTKQVESQSVSVWIHAVLEQLVNVAVVADSEAYEGILTSLVDNYRDNLSQSVMAVLSEQQANDPKRSHKKSKKDKSPPSGYVFDGVRGQLLREVPKQLLRLGTQLESENHRRALLKRLLMLVGVFASKLKATVPRSQSPSPQQHPAVESVLELFCAVLPPISELMRTVEISRESEGEGYDVWLRLYRSMWFHLTQINSGDTGVVFDIARHTPVLVGNKVTSYLEIELELTAMLDSSKANLRDYAVHSIFGTDFRAQLMHIVNQLANKELLAQIKSYKIETCAWVVCVYRLEMARVQPGADPARLSLAPMLQYLQEACIAESESNAVIQGVAQKVAETLMDTVNSMAWDANRQHCLRRNMLLLITRACSHLKRMRKIALQFIYMFLTKNTQLYYSRECIVLLLNAIDAVASALQVSALGEHTFTLCWGTREEGKEHEHVVVNFSDDPGEVLDAFNDLVSLAQHWVHTALQVVPLGTHELLHAYLEHAPPNATGGALVMSMCAFLDVTPPPPPVVAGGGGGGGAAGGGGAPANARSREHIAVAVNGTKRTMRLPTVPVFSPAASYLPTRLSTKQRFMGEVFGLCEDVGGCMGDNHAEPSDSDVVNERYLRLARSLETQLKAFSSGKSDDDLSTIMHRAVALLVCYRRSKHYQEHVCRQLDSRLVVPLCWVPVLVFNTRAVEVAVVVWRWLLAAVSSLRASMISELCSAWSATVKRRLGVFSKCPSNHRHNPDAAPLPLSPVPDPHEEQVLAHSAWLMFLFEVQQMYMFHARSAHAFLWLVVRSLDDDAVQSMSLHPLALPVRFRLLMLGLELWKQLPSVLHLSPTTLSMVQNGILNCALQWFEKKHAWYEHHFEQPTGVHEEGSMQDCIKILCGFCEMLDIHQSVIVHQQANSESLSYTERESEGSFMTYGSKSRKGDFPDDLAASRVRFYSASEPEMSDGHESPRSPRGVLRPSEGELPILNGWAKFSEAKRLVLVLASHEIATHLVWLNPTATPHNDAQAKKWAEFGSKFTTQWTAILHTAWQLSPLVGVNLVHRYTFAKVSGTPLLHLIRSNPGRFIRSISNIPHAIRFVLENLSVLWRHLDALNYFAPCSLHDAMHMLKNFPSNVSIVHFAVRSFQAYPAQEVLEFMPQLLQSLRADSTNVIKQYLIQASLSSPLIAHRLVWLILAEDVDPDAKPPPKRDAFQNMLMELKDLVISKFDEHAATLYNNEFGYFEQVNAISGILMGIDGADRTARDEARKERIRVELLKIGAPPPHLYLPTSPEARVVGVISDSGSPLQSAAKVPIIVTFVVSSHTEASTPNDQPLSKNRFRIKLKRKDKEPKGSQRVLTEGTRPQACIFKVGDDCRQDQLALQMIRCFRDAFQKVGLDLYVYPYNVVSTKPGCGVIEVVPKSKSLDQLGKSMENFLYDYFIKTYGNEEELAFQEARRNFVQSQAAYAVVSYLLQIKDRHNGNILLDEQGHLVHIDFGFIFEISPGHDLKFEMAPFKLTGEMMHVMGTPQSSAYEQFRRLCVKGYLVARQHMDEFIALAEAMADSGLPCFKPAALPNLKKRFTPQLSERQAAEHMMGLIKASESHITTYIYDYVQKKQQGITY